MAPDASRFLIFLNNIIVPFLLGDALLSASVAQIGLSLIVLFFADSKQLIATSRFLI